MNKTLFNANAYFEKICSSNKLLVGNSFKFTRISGSDLMYEVFRAMDIHRNIFAIDDTTNGRIVMERNGGYTRIRQFTVFLFMRCEEGNMDQYNSNLNICRTIHHQIITKIIADSEELYNELTTIDTESVPFQEFDKYLLNGSTGISFQFLLKEPVALCYNKSEWT